MNRREKFRIRYYNEDTPLIHLEKKSKWNGLGSKEIAVQTEAEAQAIVDGQRISDAERLLAREPYLKMRSQGLRPKTIADCTREPFSFAPGNVQATLDYDIRTGLGCTDFLNSACVTVPAGDAPGRVFT